MKPYTIIGQHLIEENAIEQMDAVMSIEPAIDGALMPDAHLGYGMPIGGVVMLDNAISPNFVGFDIACRMKLTIFKDAPEINDIDKKHWLQAMQASTQLGIGANWPEGSRKLHEVLFDPDILELGYDFDLLWRQLGTSGSGNHFLDIVEGFITDGPYAGRDFIGLLTHSGSRGPGYKTAQRYGKLAKDYMKEQNINVPRGYEWLSMDTDRGLEYFRAMTLMGKYAQANHDLIHQSFMLRLGLHAWRTYDNHHNFAWKIPGTTLYCHRKGATPASPGEIGIIPGSSGSASYIVAGLGSAAGLNSAPHGAGRPFSRKEAKRRHSGEDFTRHMSSEGIVHAGLAGDETVFAYKDIEEVIAASHELVEVIGKMRPLIVLMGGK